MSKQPKQLFRADLLAAAKHDLGRGGGNLRRISKETGVAINSIRRAIAGRPVALETLWKLAAFFGIPYSSLFDLELRGNYGK